MLRNLCDWKVSLNNPWFVAILLHNIRLQVLIETTKKYYRAQYGFEPGTSRIATELSSSIYYEFGGGGPR